MEDWQTIQRQQGRPHTLQGQQQDNGWPMRPAQTMLENYFQNPTQPQV